jgi:VWFA-related protein
MHRGLRLAVLALLVTSLTIPSSAQAPQDAGDRQEPEPSIQLEANLVNVPVRVGGPAANDRAEFRPEDFDVLEDGVPQRVTNVTRRDEPLRLTLALHVTGALREGLAEVRSAVDALVDALGPEDRLMLTSLDSREDVLVGATGDKAALRKATSKIKAGGKARLYDALPQLFYRVDKEAPGRAVVIVVTDGVDASSPMASYESTISTLSWGNTLVYPVGYDPPLRTDPKIESDVRKRFDLAEADSFLNDLASVSGTVPRRIARAAELREQLLSIASELRRQYVLAYAPDNLPKPGERRAIKVSSRVPGLSVFSRRSYVSGQGDGAIDVADMVPATHMRIAETKARWRDIPDAYHSGKDTAFGALVGGPRLTPFLSGEIGLRLTQMVLRDKWGRPVICAIVNVRPEELTFATEGDGRESAELDVTVVAVECDTMNAGGGAARTISLRGTGEAMRTLKRDGESFNAVIPIGRLWMHWVKVVVRDVRSGRTGYASQFTLLQPPTTPFFVSGILVSGGQHLSAASIGRELGIFDVTGVQSTSAARRFRRGETLSFSLLAYNAEPFGPKDRKQVNAQAQLERRDRPSVAGPVVALDARPMGESKTYLVEGSFTLGADLSPGWYVLRIAFTDEQGNKKLTPRAYAWADIEVVE